MSRATASLLQPLDLWGQRGWAGQEVAGESHYTKEIRGLFGTEYDPAGCELMVTVQLVPEPKNKHDSNAVSVRCNGTTVGYLPREDAARYVQVLSALVAEGRIPQVIARVWGGDRPTYGYDRRGRPVEGTEFVGSVRLDLAEPHMLVPANLPPNGTYALLPRGNAIQITGEETCMDALTGFLSPAGECWIHVTLHELVEQLARSTRTVVEVRVDESTAGKLTPKMSAELLPAIRHLSERGVQAAARAILKGNRVKADVTLYVARANELPQEWLDHPPTTASRRRGSAADLESGNGAQPASDAPSSDPAPVDSYGAGGAARWRFNPPPGWPPPPQGWFPPPGWRPDPSWPPAPAGWQFWIAAPATEA
jgi:collagen type III alpha